MNLDNSCSRDIYYFYFFQNHIFDAYLHLLFALGVMLIILTIDLIYLHIYLHFHLHNKYHFYAAFYARHFGNLFTYITKFNHFD